LCEENPAGTGEALTAALSLIWFGLGAWVAWMYYRALARIGHELAEIKTILLNTRPGLPSSPSHSP